MASSLSQKHHYVPRFYFKKWLANPRSGFYSYTKKPDGTIGSKVTYPAIFAVQPNLYSKFADGLFYGAPFSVEEDDSAERFLSQIETKASAACQLILQRGVSALNDTQRNDWTKFIVSLCFRLPQMISEKTAEATEINKAWLASVKLNLIDDSISNQLLAKINLDNFSKNLVLSEMVKAINDVENIRYIRDLTWLLITYKNESQDTFLTSENPLIVNMGEKYVNKLAFSLALSPTQLFAILPSELANSNDFTAMFAAGHNLLLMQQSQYLVSHKPIGDSGCIKNLKAATLYLATPPHPASQELR
jgi:hypothetical protein